MIKMKICSKCDKQKPATIEYFYRQKKGKYGLRADCKECVKKYEVENKEKISKRQKNWYENNKEKILKNTNDYYHGNKEKRAAWNKANKDKMSEYQKNYRKTYYQDNKEKILKRNRNNEKKRLKSDPNFKLVKNLRLRLREALRNNSKSASTLELLGCSVEELKIHLESQFKDGMTWENYGFYGWHIDHIRPCASFDLTHPEQQKECFHFSNLQPLWAEDNLKKRDK